MRIDKDALLREANCIDVAQYIGMDVVKRGANYFTRCPGHEKRLGKPDTKISNCVLYEKGYICYACDPNHLHNAIDMTMEFLDCSFGQALSTIAEIYGGAKNFQVEDDGKPKENIPLTPEDLALIGLKPSGKLLIPTNGSFSHFEPCEGHCIEKIGKEYLNVKTPTSYSLLQLKRTNEEAFNHIIMMKAKEAKLKYENALTQFCSRNAPQAALVYDLFEEDGYVDDAVFVGIRNALNKKVRQCTAIYETFRNKKTGT